MIEQYFTIKTIGFYVLVGILAVIILLVIFKAAISLIAMSHRKLKQKIKQAEGGGNKSDKQKV